MTAQGAATTPGTPSRCPRCGGGFDCGAASPGPCACAAVPLSAALQARLRAAYAGCLCLRCLHELAAADAAPAAAPAAGP